MQPRIPALSLAPFAVFFVMTAFSFGQDPFVPSRIIDPVDENKLTILKGNTHRLARPEFDRGPAPPDLPMDRMLLVLQRTPEQETALRTLLDDQQDKASPNYHAWLAPEQFGLQFGPNDHDIQIVISWLQSHGFQIGRVAKGRAVIEFSGFASQVQEAFHTSIHKYAVNGEEHWANANDPEIPTALTPVVAGVFTLHNFIKRPMIHIAEQKIPARLVSQGEGEHPTVTFPSIPPVYALGPWDFAKIYNLEPLYNATPPINGTNTSISVVGRSDLYNGVSDVTSFDDIFRISYLNPVGIIYDGPDPGDLGGDEEAEATLDLTWSSVVAQGIQGVGMVVSATTNTTDGADLSELYIIDNNLTDIMTESFGLCEALATNALGAEALAEQAAAEGITYFVAAGDSGPEGCDDPSEAVATGPLSVNVLAATPFNVAVGGTQFNENGDDSKYWGANAANLESALSYIPEDVWNTSCTAAQCGSQEANISAGGGGPSSIFPNPSWQSGVAGIPNNGHRNVPDVSLNASPDHDPYLLCLEGSCTPNAQGDFYFIGVGGTSASTPSFAGIMALVDQKMNGRQGQANYVLYKLAAAEQLSSCNASNTTSLPASTCIFNDVTVGNNAVPGEPSYGTSSPLYPATVGYDLATGLGSVNVTNLVNKWNSVTFSPTTTTLSIVNPPNPVTIAHGSPVSFDFAVTAKSGIPSGSVTLLPATGPTPNQRSSIGAFSLSSGSASATISSLPGGSYTLQAKYSGDGTYAPSTSAPSPAITVTAEPSTTTLSVLTLDQNFNFIPFTGGPYGSFVYLRADVVGQSKQGVATGYVSFWDGNSFLQNYVEMGPNSQGNVATPNFLNSPPGGTPTGLFTLAVGSHSLTAQFYGDPSFQASTSSPVNLNITQASTTAAVTGAGAPQGSTFTATVHTNSGGTPPTGTITFFLNGTQVGAPVGLNQVSALTTQTGALQGAQATATLNDSSLANGTYGLQASYSGDGNYVASTSAIASITQASNFLLSAGSAPAVSIAKPGDSGTLKLTLTAIDGYSGTIKFSSSSCAGLPAGASCSFSPAAVTGSGTTTLTVTTTGTTAHLVRPPVRPGWWLASLATCLAGLVFLGGSCRHYGVGGVLTLVLCAALLMGVGCGGGSGSSNGSSSPPPISTGTPTGTSNVVVTAVSGTLTHTVTFALNVD